MSLSFTESLFLGILFSATSVSISVQVLREYQKLQSLEGTVILGAAVLDDILVVLLVSIFSSLVGAGAGVKQQHIVFYLWDLVGNKLAFVLILFLFIRFVFPVLQRMVSRLLIFQPETVFALILCLVFSVLAEELGMSNVIGAFFAGVLLSVKSEKGQLIKDIEIIGYQLFIPVFFVSIGLTLDLSVFKNHFLLIVILTIVAFATKLVGGFIGSRMVKISKLSAWTIGAGMVSRGEMALIIVQLGLKDKLLSPVYFSVAVLCIIFTTVAAPLVMKRLIMQERSV